MKPQMMHVATGPGRVVIGPRKLRGCYARIVSLKDGSGRIETYNHRSGTWIPAQESITFSEVWSAPTAPALMTAHTPAELSRMPPAADES
jgi:hypothetical protein